MEILATNHQNKKILDYVRWIVIIIYSDKYTPTSS